MKFPIQVFDYSIRNAANNAVDIHIDGDIVDAGTQEVLKNWFGDTSSVSFKSFRNQVSSLDANVYNVYINSYGGHVMDAMAMHDFLDELESKGKTVNRIGRGIIASSATYILMGRNSKITKNSWFMIHNVSGAVLGDVDTVENYARTLRQFNDRIRDFYAEATKMRKEDVSKMMSKETFIKAEDAKDLGFVTEVIPSAQFDKPIPKDNWEYSDTAVLNSYNADVKTPPADDDDPDSSTNKIITHMSKLGDKIIQAFKSHKPADNADPKTVLNDVGEIIKKPLEEFETEIEGVIATKVTEAVANATKTNDESIKTIVNAAVAEAVKNYNEKITALETANTELEKKATELEKDITKMKGAGTRDNHSNPADEFVIGKFN